MSSNIEFSLLTRIIDDKDFSTLEKMRITEDYFQSPESKEVYRYLRQMFHDPATNGQLPSREMLKYRFPAFFFPQAFDTVPVLATELRREKIKLELQLLGNELLDKAELDPEEALAALKTKYSTISGFNEGGEDLSMSAAYQQLLERYELVAEANGTIGIPFPWEPLNEETQGMQGGQFIVFYGRPKNMKSWAVIHCAVHAYMHARKRVLYYTREMPPLQIAARAAADIAQVDYAAFKKGKLQPELKKKVFTILKDLMEDEKYAAMSNQRNPYLIITTDRSAKMGGSGGGISWLQAKIRDLKPDLVIVDGMYLLRDDRSGQRTIDWKAIAHISQDLKLTAQEFDIPVIGVTQANRSAEKSKGEDLTELAFSDSLGQDADAVFRVTKKFNNETQRWELIITAPGLREGVLDGIVIQGEPATNFNYLRAITHKDESSEEGYGEGKTSSKPSGGGYNGVKPTFSGRKSPQQFMPKDPRI